MYVHSSQWNKSPFALGAVEVTAGSVMANGICDTSALESVYFQHFRLDASCWLVVSPQFKVLKSRQVDFLSFQILHSNYKSSFFLWMMTSWANHQKGPLSQVCIPAMGLSPIDSFTLIQPETLVAIYEIGFLGVMNVMYGHRICKMYKILAVMD